MTSPKKKNSVRNKRNLFFKKFFKFKKKLLATEVCYTCLTKKLINFKCLKCL